MRPIARPLALLSLIASHRPSPAAAQANRPRRAEADAEAGRRPDGTIVQLEEGTVYFDVGGAKGIRPGQTVQVLRTITARHPVTGAPLTDHFPLGALVVGGVGEVLSFGRVERRLVPLVKVGDVVRIATTAASAEPARAMSRRTLSDGAGGAAANESPAVEMGRAFQSTLGRPLAERIEILERFLATHADTPFRDSVEREIASLKVIAATLREAMQRAEAARSAPAAAPQRAPSARAPVVGGNLPARLYEGDPLDVAVYVANPAEVAAAFVYARRPDATAFQRHPLAADGDGYFRARLPAAEAAPPAVEVFVEVVGRSGETTQRFGTAAQPDRIEVEKLPGGPPEPGSGRSAVRGVFEFVDFNRFRGNDYYLVAESDFTFRVNTFLYAVRTGFGVLYGRGGRVSDLDKSDDPELRKGHEVGFNYGYVEAELRFHRLFSVSGRLLGGQTVQGDGIGGELRMRIGNELGTNLVLGGAIANDIGALALLQLEWDVIHGWPMSATVMVTNQPAWEDIGVRLVYQLSYRAKSWLQPTLRIGYDARNIDHGGLSLGLGLVMAW